MHRLFDYEHINLLALERTSFSQLIHMATKIWWPLYLEGLFYFVGLGFVSMSLDRQNNYLCGTRIVVTNKRTWRYKCFLTFSINPVKVSVLIIQKPGNLHVDKALVESWYSRCSTFDDFCNVITLTFCYWNVLFFRSCHKWQQKYGDGYVSNDCSSSLVLGLIRCLQTK